jgi:CRP/FNR family cyclic AMP-dependent transcriptional regulator
MPAIPDPTYLRQVTLFRDMALPDLAVLNGLMRRQVFPSGVRVVVTEQLEDTAYVIRTGAVKVFVEQADGNDVMLAILGPGDVIGALTVGQGSGDTFGDACSIVSLEETTLFWIDCEALERCLRTMPLLSANLVTVLARRVRLANERIEALAGPDVRGRIVRHLLLLAREYGEPADEAGKGTIRIPLRLTQGDLASLVGTSRTSVNQALGELRRRRLLSTDEGQHLLIHDLEALGSLR